MSTLSSRGHHRLVVALWVLAPTACAAVAVTVRAGILFAGSRPGGVDAGYYPLQAKWLWEHGALLYGDAPVIFVLDLALGLAAQAVAGWPLDDALVWSASVIDSLMEPLICAPLTLFAWRVARGRVVALPTVVAACGFATLAPSVLRMVGDFEKQSMSLMVMAWTWLAFAWALGAPDAPSRWRRGWAPALGVIAACMTHTGAGAAATVGSVLIASAWMLAAALPLRRVLLACAVGACALVMLWIAIRVVAPDKARVILDAPFTLFDFSDGQRAATHGDPMALGGPPGMRPFQLSVPAWTVGSIALAAITALAWWWAQRSIAVAAERARWRATGATAFGLALLSAFLLCPLIVPGHSDRLSLIAPVSLAFVGAFLALAPTRMHGALPRLASVVLPACALVALVPMLAVVRPPRAGASDAGDARGPTPPQQFGPGSPGQRMISDAGYDELRSWRDSIQANGTFLVIARHGLEFWAGYALGGAGRPQTEYGNEFTAYDRVYLLIERHSDLPGTGPYGVRGARGALSPDDARLFEQLFGEPPPGQPTGDAGDPDQFGMRDGRPFDRRGGPPGGSSRDLPFGPPDENPPRQRGGPPGMGGMTIDPVPTGATIVKRGEHFTLYHIPESARVELFERGPAGTKRGRDRVRR